VLGALTGIFEAFDGDEQRLLAKKRGIPLLDFLWLPAGQVVEYDETAHFTRARAATLSLYPRKALLGFDRHAYSVTCNEWWKRAERRYAHKTAVEFPGPLSRARQRAYFDAVRDLCAPHTTGAPVLRVAAPERRPSLAFRRFEEFVR
jgi:hypothetical protein